MNRLVPLFPFALACASDIANTAFYEEERYLEALPSEDLGVAALAEAPPRGATLAERLGTHATQILLPVTRNEEALRQSPPQRGPSARYWKVQSVSTMADGEPFVALWWIAAEVV